MAFPRHKIAYRFATTPEANAVCTTCGRWAPESHLSEKHGLCGGSWVNRSEFPQGEVNAAAMWAIAAGLGE